MNIEDIEWTREEETLLCEAYGKLDQAMYLFEKARDFEKIEILKAVHSIMRQLATLIAMKHIVAQIEEGEKKGE